MPAFRAMRTGSSMSMALATFAMCALVACEGKLDEKRFRKRAEDAYREAHPGWTIAKKRETLTYFVRVDQVETLDVAALFADYDKSGQSASDFLDAWVDREKRMAAARRRTFSQAAADVVPVIKSGSWVNVQDLGAIGPARMMKQIRPWRKKIAEDVFVVLGVPEERLGLRIASIQEVEDHKDPPDAFIEKAVAELRKEVTTSSRSVEMHGKEGNLLAIDFENVDGISALILSERFRQDMLAKFQLPELGAAVPTRNVLVVFDPKDFVTIKPIRARTHSLYDTQNHPGFRGLLRFDKAAISILEPARPAKKKRRR